jgi:hypothetical protein
LHPADAVSRAVIIAPITVWPVTISITVASITVSAIIVAPIRVGLASVIIRGRLARRPPANFAELRIVGIVAKPVTHSLAIRVRISADGVDQRPIRWQVAFQIGRADDQEQNHADDHCRNHDMIAARPAIVSSVAGVARTIFLFSLFLLFVSRSHIESLRRRNGRNWGALWGWGFCPEGQNAPSGVFQGQGRDLAHFVAESR